ncbi:MAG: metallophosphoesterase [Candidatus Micrarchaeaceae archaeon]
MILDKNVEIIEGLPVIYIKSLSAIVCSDLHLGYEGVFADSGTFLPKRNLSHIMKILKIAKEKTNANTLIITGDIKNDFSKVHTEELNEYFDLISYIKLKLKIEDIKIIKGNHDNFIDSINKDNVKIYSKEAKLADFIFIHGSELPQSKKFDFLIMGHIHPSLFLISDTGKKEKLKCFLFGKNKNNQKILVIPAMSYFSEGLSVNLERVDRMAPIFKEIFNIDELQALCIGEGETLDFGKIGNLKKLMN